MQDISDQSAALGRLSGGHEPVRSLRFRRHDRRACGARRRDGLGHDLDLGGWSLAHDADLPERLILGLAAGSGQQMLLHQRVAHRADG
jgi:hypothetical protein